VDITPLDDDLLRQSTDAFSAYRALQRAKLDAQQVRGGMLWRQKGGRDYLIRTSPTGLQKGLGARSPEAEAIYENFIERKLRAETTLQRRKAAVVQHERMNRALRIGRMPSVVVELLRRLEQSNLSEFFRVVGTFAIYAYEHAAGVRLANSVLQTNDVDLLWDVQRRIQFVDVLGKADEASLIRVLKKVDKTFVVRNDQPYTAINDDGFEVDILRRIPKGDDPHPFRMSEDVQDFWAVPATTAETMTSAAPFSQVVVATTGKMAIMHTVHPLTFVSIKERLAALKERDPLKRRRDLAQAQAVAEIVDNYLPHLAEDFRNGRPKPFG